MSYTVLIVDDDPHIRDVLNFALQKAGMTTRQAGSGTEALEQLQSAPVDILVLDINMPRMDGLEVCRQVRATTGTPILFLSSRDDEIDRIIGLELGADDYVTKPFSPREVVARVNAILTRFQASPRSETKAPEALVRGHLALHPNQRDVSWKEEIVTLTTTEFDLLMTMLRHPQKVFTRDQLIDGAYGAGFAISDRTIDSHVRHLRAKFVERGGSDVIETVHGYGYKLGACQAKG
jgi:two-component system, OmpR family, response regulator